MIDHLLIAPDEATLIAVIGNTRHLWYAGDTDSPAGWRGDVSFPVDITDNADPLNPVLLTDYHLWVALPTQDMTLSALPNCVLVANRDAANAGQPFILQTAFTQDQMNNYIISPVVAGSNYPFGSA